MKVIKAIWSIIKFLISVIIIVIIAIILVQRFSNNNISVAGYRIFTVVTESMVPKYLVGDVLLVKQTDAKKIKIEDDVAYMGKVGSYADKVITHQVIKIENVDDGTLNFHTKGIANPEEDPLINESQIYGVVIAKLSIMSKLNGIINNMYGMYFLIIIPLGIIIYSEFKAFRDEKKDIDEEDIEDEEKNENYDVEQMIKKRKERRAKRRNRYK